MYIYITYISYIYICIYIIYHIYLGIYYTDVLLHTCIAYNMYVIYK